MQASEGGRARGCRATKEGRKSAGEREKARTREKERKGDRERERVRRARGRIPLLFVRHVRAWPPHAYPLRAPVASYFID